MRGCFYAPMRYHAPLPMTCNTFAVRRYPGRTASPCTHSCRSSGSASTRRTSCRATSVRYHRTVPCMQSVRVPPCTRGPCLACLDTWFLCTPSTTMHCYSCATEQRTWPLVTLAGTSRGCSSSLACLDTWFPLGASNPGDVVMFDMRCFHAAFNGK